MKKEQQRIKIAEACGWTDCHMPAASNQSMPFTERVLCGIAPGRRVHTPLPDYLNDLNAMHESEMITGFDRYPLRERYYPHLIDAKDKDGTDLPIWLATAAQRAEAFLRTLNLWEDEQ